MQASAREGTIKATCVVIHFIEVVHVSPVSFRQTQVLVIQSYYANNCWVNLYAVN